MEILPRLGLRFKIIQGSRKGSPTKVPLTLLGSSNVKCLPPSLKNQEVVVLMLRSLFVLIVAENMKARV